MVRIATILVLAAILVLPAILAACSGSRGAPAPDAQSAVLIPENQTNRQRAAGVFGVACGSGHVHLRVQGRCGGSARGYRVPAGPQQLQVAFTDDDTPLDSNWDDMWVRVQAVPMSFQALAGRTYAVRGQTRWTGNEPSVTLWIVDGANGQTVTSYAVPRARVHLEEYVPPVLR